MDVGGWGVFQREASREDDPVVCGPGGGKATGGRGVADEKAAMMSLPAILDDEAACGKAVEGGLKDLTFLFFGMPGGGRLVRRARMGRSERAQRDEQEAKWESFFSLDVS